MEALVTIVAVGAYAERQYQKQDGTTEYFKSRGVTMKRGGDVFYGEMTGHALHREGCVEAPDMGREQRPT